MSLRVPLIELRGLTGPRQHWRSSRRAIPPEGALTMSDLNTAVSEARAAASVADDAVNRTGDPGVSRLCVAVAHLARAVEAIAAEERDSGRC